MLGSEDAHQLELCEKLSSSTNFTAVMHDSSTRRWNVVAESLT